MRLLFILLSLSGCVSVGNLSQNNNFTYKKSVENEKAKPVIMIGVSTGLITYLLYKKGE